MKRLLLPFLLLAAMLYSNDVMAEEYNLWVAGTKVTDANKSDIKPAVSTALQAGTITFKKFSDEYSELIFTDVKLRSSEALIDIQMPGVWIVFRGENELTVLGGKANAVIESKYPFSMTGSELNERGGAYVTFKDTNESTSWVSNAIDYSGGDGVVGIMDLHLNVSSKNWCAIYSHGGGTLSLSNVELTATTGANCYCGAIHGFEAVKANDAAPFQENMVYKEFTGSNPRSMATYDTDGNLLKEVRTIPRLVVGGCIVRTNASLTTQYSPRGVKDGKQITFNPSTATLTFDNIEWELTDGHERCIVENNGIDNLTISVKGSNSINTKFDGIRSKKNLTFANSEGTNNWFLLTTTGADAMRVEGSRLALWSDWVTFAGASHGIVGADGATLNIFNSLVWAQGGDGAICGFDKCHRTGVTTVLPEGACWRKSLGGWGTTEGLVKGKTEDDLVVIKKANEIYPIMIGGEKITDLNASNVVADGLTNGTISYDKNTKTLTMKDVEFTTPDDPLLPEWPFSNWDDGTSALSVNIDAGSLTVNLAGSNKLNSDRYGIYTEADLTFIGSGSLDVKSKKLSGMRIDDKKVKLETSRYILCEGSTSGVVGTGNAILEMTKTTDDFGYAFKGYECTIKGLADLILNNMDFSYDNGGIHMDGCYFEDGMVKQNGGIVAKGSKYVAFKSIKEPMGIEFAGNSINRTNPSDIYTISVGSPYIKEGGPRAVVYNPQTKTLTLNNAVIDGVEDIDAIRLRNGFEGTIELVGNNSITVNSTAWNCIVNNHSSVKSTITGNGSLYLNGGKHGIYIYRGEMTIGGDVNIEAHGTAFGIGSNGHGANGETLTIGGNAHVFTNTIGGLASMTLADGQMVLNPAGAVVRTVAGMGSGVYVNETMDYYALDVEIGKAKPYDLYIAGVQVTSANCDDILGDGVFQFVPAEENPELFVNYNGGDFNYDNTAFLIENTGINGLNIHFQNVKLVSKQPVPFLSLNASTIIRGAAILEYGNGSFEGTGIRCHNCNDLNIVDANIRMLKGFGHGIMSDTGGKLNLENTYLRIGAKKHGCVYGFDEITMKDCYVDEPRPSQIKDGAFCDGDGTIVGSTMDVKFLTIKQGGDGIAIDAVNFPDDHFREYIIKSVNNYDANKDGYLNEAEIAASKEIDVSSWSRIYNLKGVEFFTALTKLNCGNQELTSLDVSKNTALETLWCDNNKLTALDLTNNVALKDLVCGQNPLGSLDVTKNTALTSLGVYETNVGTLDLSKNTALETLYVGEMPLSMIDVTHCQKLTHLEVYVTQITSIDLSRNTEIDILSVFNNQLTSLDLSALTKLSYLDCSSNQLTTLDLSKNTLLSELDCSRNQLTTLDLSNNPKVHEIFCQKNLIRGNGMTAMVASLPTVTEGHLYVYEDETPAGNEMTDVQVAAAKAKHWTPLYYDLSEENWLPYAGVDGIAAVEIAPQDANGTVYDTIGRRLSGTHRGVNIIRTADGKAVKVVRK